MLGSVSLTKASTEMENIVQELIMDNKNERKPTQKLFAVNKFAEI